MLKLWVDWALVKGLILCFPGSFISNLLPERAILSPYLSLSVANSNIKQQPEEIRHLSLLRLLDLTECNFLIQISANDLASLSRL